MCGDLDSLELGDTVEYTLAKGKGNKVSAEKVTKVAPGTKGFTLISKFQHDFERILTSTVFPPAVNAIGDDVSSTVLMGKVIRPLRSVDPSQTDYQGLIEVTEEGWWCLDVIKGLHFTRPFYMSSLTLHELIFRVARLSIHALREM